jgi:hypothetical protein
MAAKPDDSPIAVNVIVPRNGILRVTVSRTEEIAAVCSRFSIGGSELVFKGQLLDRRHTFDDCQINHNDSIVVVNAASEAPDRDSAKSRWLRVTRDDNELDSTIMFASNLETRREFLRLRDIHRRKIESSPRKFLHMCRTELGIPQEAVEPTRHDTVIPRPPSHVSTEQLPCAW